MESKFLQDCVKALAFTAPAFTVIIALLYLGGSFLGLYIKAEVSAAVKVEVAAAMREAIKPFVDSTERRMNMLDVTDSRFDSRISTVESALRGR